MALANSKRADASARWSEKPDPINWAECKVVSAGVDYITGVCQTEATSETMRAWTHRIYGWEKKGGAIEKGWGLSGFSGFKMGQLEFGRRNEEFIVRLISECSRVHWAKVYQFADTLTRLDLQITVDIKTDPQPYVWQYFHDANKHSARLKRGPKNDVVLGSDGGATLYCGKRKSNLFGRAYARGPKTKCAGDETHLRFEVQFNKRLALLVARELAGAKVPGTYAAERVVQFFKARGVPLEMKLNSLTNICLSRSRSDCDKKLLWLESSVRKSVELLAERGRLEEAIAALGLEEFVTVKRR